MYSIRYKNDKEAIDPNEIKRGLDSLNELLIKFQSFTDEQKIQEWNEKNINRIQDEIVRTQAYLTEVLALPTR